MPGLKPFTKQSCYLQSYAFCISSVVDVHYVQMYNLCRFLKTYTCSLVSKCVGDTALIFMIYDMIYIS
jgi:hypothetical protein